MIGSLSDLTLDVIAKKFIRKDVSIATTLILSMIGITMANDIMTAIAPIDASITQIVIIIDIIQTIILINIIRGILAIEEKKAEIIIGMVNGQGMKPTTTDND